MAKPESLHPVIRDDSGTYRPRVMGGDDPDGEISALRKMVEAYEAEAKSVLHGSRSVFVAAPIVLYFGLRAVPVSNNTPPLLLSGFFLGVLPVGALCIILGIAWRSENLWQASYEGHGRCPACGHGVALVSPAQDGLLVCSACEGRWLPTRFPKVYIAGRAFGIDAKIQSKSADRLTLDGRGCVRRIAELDASDDADVTEALRQVDLATYRVRRVHSTVWGIVLVAAICLLVCQSSLGSPGKQVEAVAMLIGVVAMLMVAWCLFSRRSLVSAAIAARTLFARGKCPCCRSPVEHTSDARGTECGSCGAYWKQP